MTRRTDEFRDADGFTLVETLVSLALLALMAVYALQSFQTTKEIDAIGERLQAQNEVNAAARVLQNEISTARLAFSEVGTQQQKLLFEGTQHSLTYVTASNGAREIGGMYLVKVFLNDDGALLMTRQLIRNDNSAPTETVTLVRGAKSLSLRFLNGGKDAVTVNSWLGMDHLPDSTEMEVGFASDDLRHWPPVIARSRLRN